MANVSLRVRAVFFSLIAAGAAASGLAFTAQAADEVAVDVSIKDHKFEPSEIKVPAAKAIKITVKNLDASAEEFESHQLGFEKVIAGNSSATIRVKPLAAGKYKFFGEYHEATAQGHIVAE